MFGKTHPELIFNQPTVRSRNCWCFALVFFFVCSTLIVQSGEYTGPTPLIFWKAKSSFHPKIPQLKKNEQLTRTVPPGSYSVASLPQSPASEEVLSHKSPCCEHQPCSQASSLGSASGLPSSNLQLWVPAAPQSATQRKQS